MQEPRATVPDDLSTTPTLWRPLSFGEIFDRAITLYAGNFVQFVILALVVAVPIAFLEQFTGIRTGHGWRMLGLLSPSALSDNAAALKMIGAEVLAGAIFWLFGLAFVGGVIAIGVAALYERRPVRLNGCIRAMYGAWPGSLWLLVPAVCAIIDSQSDSFFATFAAYFPETPGGKEFLAVPIVALIGLAIALVGAALSVPCYFAFCAVAIEGVEPESAWERAFDMVFAGGDFWRAIGVAVGAAGFVFVAIFVPTFFVGSAWLHGAVQTIAQIVLTPFAFVVLTVLYFDIRIRREGLDLQTAAAALVPQEAFGG